MHPSLLQDRGKYFALRMSYYKLVIDMSSINVFKQDNTVTDILTAGTISKGYRYNELKIVWIGFQG